MAQSDFPLLTPTDALISEFFAGLETALNAEATFQVKGIQTPIKSGTQEFKELSKSGAQIIHHALIRQGNISIIYNASQIIQADGKVVPHPYYSFIRVSSPDNNPANTLTFPDILKIGGFIRENGLSPSLSASQEVGEGSTASDILRNVAISAADQIARTNQFFRELTEEFDGRRRALEDAYQQKSKDFADKTSAQEVRFAEQLEEINKQRKELDDRSKYPREARNPRRTDQYNTK